MVHYLLSILIPYTLCFAVASPLSTTSIISSTATSIITSTIPASITPSTTITSPGPPPPMISPSTPTSTHPCSSRDMKARCTLMFTELIKYYYHLYRQQPPWTQEYGFARDFCAPGVRKKRKERYTPWCRRCTDINRSTKKAWNTFNSTVEDFCQTEEPSLFLLSRGIVDFVDFLSPYFALGHEDSLVVRALVHKWESAFSSRTSRPTGLLPKPTTPASGTAAADASSTTPATVPTEALSQLPPAWPYTRPAVARRPGQSATFTITNAQQTSIVEYVVVASIAWYPRPLGSRDGLLQSFNQSSILVDDVATESDPTPLTGSTPSLMNPGV